MKTKIMNNVMDVSYFQISAVGIIPEFAVLRDVRLTYATDGDGKRMEQVVAVRYECVDADTFSTFTVKVETAKPVITAEELERAEDMVVLELPVDEMVIKPYALEYGKAKVSIVAPYVKIQK